MVVACESVTMFKSASPGDIARLPKADDYCRVEFQNKGLEFTWSKLPNKISINSNVGSLLGNGRNNNKDGPLVRRYMEVNVGSAVCLQVR